MRILYATSEAMPFAKTGGLADVAGALPRALADLGHDVRMVMPLYDCIREDKFGLSSLFPEMRARVQGFDHVGRVHRTNFPGTRLPVYFIENRLFFGRKGLYQERGQDYPDNPLRFGFFSLAALWTLRGLHWSPHVIMCNDWQTGLIPAFLRHLEIMRHDPFFSRIKTLFTIHNLAFQGLADPANIPLLGLPWSVFTMEGLEFYGKMSLLKSGIVYADKINTVSPRYAEEIQTKELGCGLEGALRARRADLSGILNGIDPAIWSPEADDLIPARYSAQDLSGKILCKSALRKRCDLPETPNTPLIGVISRLTDQKGFDLIEEAAKELLEMPIQMVFLGTGDARREAFLAKLARRRPDKVRAILGFDDQMAHWIKAGADMFLMPSRFEPCGLNQLYSLRYGTIPIVRRTGGLADSITDYDPSGNDEGDGFVFEEYEAKAMLEAVGRAVAVCRSDPGQWKAIQQRAMRRDFTWSVSARKYDELLRSMVVA